MDGAKKHKIPIMLCLRGCGYGHLALLGNKYNVHTLFHSLLLK